METIRNYLKAMFAGLPDTPEVRKAYEELAAMMEDKYTELIDEGKSENEAVGTVISEFGNRDELAQSLGIEEYINSKAAAEQCQNSEKRPPVGRQYLLPARAEHGVPVIRRCDGVYCRGKLLGTSDSLWCVPVHHGADRRYFDRRSRRRIYRRLLLLRRGSAALCVCGCGGRIFQNVGKCCETLDVREEAGMPDL